MAKTYSEGLADLINKYAEEDAKSGGQGNAMAILDMLSEAIANPHKIDPVSIGQESFDDSGVSRLPDWVHNMRTEYKTVGNSPHDAIEKYAEQAKKMGAKFLHDGDEIYIRLPGESKAIPLDPSGWSNNVLTDPSVENLKELGRDVADLGFDLPAASIAAPIVGKAALTGTAMTGNPIGGLAAGAMTALALGSAKEYGRQRIGKGTGINKNIDPYRVATAGITEGLATPLFGTGVNKFTPIPKSLAARLTEIAGKNMRLPPAEVAALLAHPEGAKVVADILGKTAALGGATGVGMKFAKSGIKAGTSALSGIGTKALDYISEGAGALNPFKDNEAIFPTTNLVNEEAWNLRKMLSEQIRKYGKEASTKMDDAMTAAGGYEPSALINKLQQIVQDAKAAYKDAPTKADKKLLKQDYKFARGLLEKVQVLAQENRTNVPGNISTSRYNALNKELGRVIKQPSEPLPDLNARASADFVARTSKDVKEAMNKAAYNQLGTAQLAKDYADSKVASDTLGILAPRRSDTAGLQSIIGDTAQTTGAASDIKRGADIVFDPVDRFEFGKKWDKVHANYQFENPHEENSIFKLVTRLGSSPQTTARVGAGAMAVAEGLGTGSKIGAQRLFTPIYQIGEIPLPWNENARMSRTLDPVEEQEQNKTLKNLMNKLGAMP